MDTLTKAITIITNAFTILGNKIDKLGSEIKKQKPPIIKMDAPQINVDLSTLKMPEFPPYPEMPHVEMPVFPEIPAPIVNVPAPIVNVEAPIVNVPPANITLEPAPVTFPDEMKVQGMKELIDAVNQEPEPYPKLLDGISNKNPIPVQMVDSKGRPFTASDFGGEGGPSTVAIRVGTTPVGDNNPMPVTTDGFAIPMFDTQVIDESAAPTTTTITYSRDGTTVAVKTITVSGTTTTISVVIS
jgi:hypothetical protein